MTSGKCIEGWFRTVQEFHPEKPDGSGIRPKFSRHSSRIQLLILQNFDHKNWKQTRKQKKVPLIFFSFWCLFRKPDSCEIIQEFRSAKVSYLSHTGYLFVLKQPTRPKAEDKPKNKKVTLISFSFCCCFQKNRQLQNSSRIPVG